MWDPTSQQAVHGLFTLSNSKKTTSSRALLLRCGVVVLCATTGVSLWLSATKATVLHSYAGGEGGGNSTDAKLAAKQNHCWGGTLSGIVECTKEAGCRDRYKKTREAGAVVTTVHPIFRGGCSLLLLQIHQLYALFHVVCGL